MKKSLIAAVAAALMASAVHADRPLIPFPSDVEIKKQCGPSLTRLKKQARELESIPVQTQEGALAFLKGWNRLQTGVENLQGPMSLLAQVSPEDKVKKEADACSLKIQDFLTDLYQNSKLYANMRLVRVMDDAERKLRQDALSAYEDAGVALVPEKRERVKQILAQLTEIRQEFNRNIRENKTKLTFTAYELQGLPASYLQKFEHDSAGNYRLGFSYPEYIPFMQYAENDAARERYRFAFINRGTPRNLKLLQKAINLRHELAVVSGYRSYADFALRRRMAKKPIAVERLLSDIDRITAESARRELEELARFKSAVRNIPIEQAVIKRSDVNYWQERVKQIKYNVDDNILRNYFPTQATMEWAMGVASKLYGIRFRQADVPVWHQDVRYYDVLDGGDIIGGVYIDLYPRKGKYSHAATFPVRGSSTLEKRLPVSALVANFDRKGLSMREVETLLHEFGHVLHGVLSKTRFVDQSGTSVERDFVEVPSQLFEEWAYSYPAISILPQYCSGSCPTMDREMLNRLNAARKFGLGINYSRQSLYSRYDMMLHSDKNIDVMKTWKNLERNTPLGYDGGTEFPGQFSHLVGGYAAGYYGYLWSKVIALDMLTKFNGNLMDENVGKRFRRYVLEHGSEYPAERMVRAFLGRQADTGAFYDRLQTTSASVSDEDLSRARAAGKQ